jgi:hypothetical protein
MKKEFVIVLVIAGILLSAFIIITSKKQAPTNIPETQESSNGTDTTNANTIPVVASNNSFSPSNFSSIHLDTLILSVKAVDHDYTFSVADYPRLRTVISKGSTKEITISGLGVGEYEYSCGAGCSGKISITQKTDTED